ncbi:ubiquinol-cytochrome-c reductase complex assembly factor 2 [Phlebotomus argentipes]|uniref:ubiquinol-cytochrome-c reductase complex assembly factor 2 n=1 Tax=Phlebotomus argentipes TaxID=94469 RepID=UPI002892BA9C|nr:ubiquinol-cytochrome-c reductase complex assembly factor 2 [Phlebotomus argentipes]
MSANYRRFLKILEKWPVDKSKAGRDLAEDLRDQLKNLLVREQETNFNAEKFTKELDALSRIEKSVHGKSYARNFKTTATGLTGEQCNQVLSSEFLEYMNTK